MLAKTIRFLFRNPDAGAEMERKAREYIETDSSRQIISGKDLDLFRHI
jgi:hypothetical protein